MEIQTTTNSMDTGALFSATPRTNRSLQDSLRAPFCCPLRLLSLVACIASHAPRRFLLVFVAPTSSLAVTLLHLWGSCRALHLNFLDVMFSWMTDLPARTIKKLMQSGTQWTKGWMGLFCCDAQELVLSHHVLRRRKERREAREKEELRKYRAKLPTLHSQFADIKRGEHRWIVLLFLKRICAPCPNDVTRADKGLSIRILYRQGTMSFEALRCYP